MNSVRAELDKLQALLADYSAESTPQAELCILLTTGRASAALQQFLCSHLGAPSLLHRLSLLGRESMWLAVQHCKPCMRATPSPKHLMLKQPLLDQLPVWVSRERACQYLSNCDGLEPARISQPDFLLYVQATCEIGKLSTTGEELRRRR